MPAILLNWEKRPRDIGGEPADALLLDYLRGLGLTGTKEGCASGDCGACAVAVGEPDESGGARYRAVNSCICFLRSLAGRQIVTVEGLADADGPHPAQRAMVEHHASQCGFCTPGFVMALFSHFHGGGKFGRADVVSALAGNLCRCTGYRPIIAAGMSLKDAKVGRARAHAMRRAGAEMRKLRGAPADGGGFFAPERADEAAAFLEKRPAARVLAGGTDLGLEVSQELKSLSPVLHLGRARDLARTAEDDNSWTLGAGASFAQCSEVLAGLPDFSELAARFGSPQIRARATVGGNIANASPVADGPPLFLALDGVLTLRRGRVRREVPLANFFRAYKKTALRAGEMIESIRLRKPRAGALFRAMKVSKRREDDIAAVCGVFNLEISGGRVRRARIAFGGMAATPSRARFCEKALNGETWGRASVEKAAAALARDFSPISDARASAEYRARVAGNLLRKVLLESQ